MKRLFATFVLAAVCAVCGLTALAQQRAQSAGDDGTYFTAPQSGSEGVDSEGFIRRWLILDPINKPNRSNTVFTDSYLHNEFGKEYFAGQMTDVPADGAKVKLLIVEPEPDFGTDFRQTPKPQSQPKKKPRKEKDVYLQWHDLESTGYNVQLYRFARSLGKRVYGVIFWVVAVIDCDEPMENVRLSVGSNSASMWWLDGKEVLTLSGDRRMVRDDAMSERLTLQKGRNVLRGAIINGPGMSNFCVRFIDETSQPITNMKISNK